MGSFILESFGEEGRKRRDYEERGGGRPFLNLPSPQTGDLWERKSVAWSFKKAYGERDSTSANVL